MSSVSTGTKSQSQESRVTQQRSPVTYGGCQSLMEEGVSACLRRRRGRGRLTGEVWFWSHPELGICQYEISIKEATATCVVRKTIRDTARDVANINRANRSSGSSCPIDPTVCPYPHCPDSPDISRARLASFRTCESGSESQQRSPIGSEKNLCPYTIPKVPGHALAETHLAGSRASGVGLSGGGTGGGGSRRGLLLVSVVCGNGVAGPARGGEILTVRKMRRGRKGRELGFDEA